MPDTDTIPTGGIVNDLMEPTIRLLLILAILGVIQLSLSIIPGVGLVVIQPDITVATILYSLLTLLMFGAIVNFSATAGSVLAETFPDVPDIETAVRLVFFIAITIWAYQTFWWLPYFRQHPAQYDFLFLIVGIGLVGWLAFILYSNLDDLSALATGKIMETDVTDMVDDRLGADADSQQTESSNPQSEN